MKPITNSKQCTEVDSQEIYISWNDMKWDTFGNVRSYNESVKDMCKPSDGTTNIFLTGTIMNYSAILNLNQDLLYVFRCVPINERVHANLQKVG